MARGLTGDSPKEAALEAVLEASGTSGGLIDAATWTELVDLAWSKRNVRFDRHSVHGAIQDLLDAVAANRESASDADS
jgi:hypothetical protein